ncbi:hypothetical protein SAMN02787142_0673 [Burkholderia sp. WP9]|nr:hypothetical protein SAMN02787142_0673 [Burkholderia sp. WP9]
MAEAKSKTSSQTMAQKNCCHREQPRDVSYRTSYSYLIRGGLLNSRDLEARVDSSFLTRANLIDGGFHIVVDATSGNAA